MLCLLQATPNAQPQPRPNVVCIPSVPVPAIDRTEDYLDEGGVTFLRITTTLVNRYVMTQVVMDGAGTVVEVLNQTPVDLPVSAVEELVEMQEAFEEEDIPPEFEEIL